MTKKKEKLNYKFENRLIYSNKSITHAKKKS